MNYIKNHDKKTAEYNFFLVNKLSKLIKYNKHALRNEIIITENWFMSRIVQQGFGCVKVMSTYNFLINEERTHVANKTLIINTY